MREVMIIGLDLAKKIFQAHGMRADGGVAFRTKLSRTKVLSFSPFNPAALWQWRPVPALIIGDGFWGILGMRQS